MTGKDQMAMAAPVEALAKIDAGLMARALEGSRTSRRKRIILPLHKGPEALLQRMLNAIQPDSYIRPHRHADERGESLVVLRGRLRYLTFSDDGRLQTCDDLSAGEGMDIEGGIWHSFLALETDTVLFEVKPGPYNAETDKEFASWAPEEFSADVSGYVAGWDCHESTQRKQS